MNAESINELEKQIYEAMAVREEEIAYPALSAKARRLVSARKKNNHFPMAYLLELFSFSRLQLRFYPLGLTALLFSFACLYLSGPAHEHSSDAMFFDQQHGLSISNSTISVNSSTMLTSIPTLVIRN